MSLQKIQVELSVIRLIGEPQEDGELNLGAKIWNDFKNWRTQPKYTRKLSAQQSFKRQRTPLKDLRKPAKTPNPQAPTQRPNESQEQPLLPADGKKREKKMSMKVPRKDSLAKDRASGA